MNKSIKIFTALCCLFSTITGSAQKPTDTPTSQMEKLGRGLVVAKYITGRTTIKYFASWRMLGTDDKNTSFTLLKNGEVLKNNICNATCVSDITATTTDKFQVVTYQNGQEVETTPEVTPWSNYYMELPLDKPATGSDYTYSPNDCSVGDVDGDGQYEIFVKWNPSNSKVGMVNTRYSSNGTHLTLKITARMV